MLVVCDADDVVVARIRTTFWSRRFTAFDAAGGVLCTGRPTIFTRAFEIADAAEFGLLTVRTTGFAGWNRRVELADGTLWCLDSPG